MIKKKYKQVSKVDRRHSFLGLLKIESVALNSISLEKSSILQGKHFVLSQTLLKISALFYFQHDLYLFMPRWKISLCQHPALQ